MLTLEQLHETFEKFRGQYEIGGQPRKLYEPVDYIMGLGGKRMRPLLLMIAYQMYGKDLDSAMEAALGMELLHNYTLVHDDIMDGASLRRGEDTVYKAYGVNSAILSGDVMQVRSFDLVMRSCSDDNLRAAMDLVFSTSREICEGQQMDMDFEERPEVSVDEYLEMIKLKTAVLLSACLKLGGILAGASEEECAKLYQAGLLFGQAFQIQDDLLDAYGQSSSTGKRRGGDIVNSKKTYLYARTLQKLPALRRDVFIEMYNEEASNPEVKIQKVLRVMDEFEIERIVTARVEDVYQQGMRMLDELSASEVLKIPLVDIIKKLKVRNV